MRQPPIDKRLRAQFKELARRIIAQDRAARKYGQSQNTIGAIERGLVHAFQLGREVATVAQPAEQGDRDFVDWIEIAPRARDTLFSIAGGLKWDSGAESRGWSVTLEHTLVGDRYRWRVVGGSNHSFSDGGVLPLVRMGVLEPVDGSDELLRLSQLGIATCREFLRRWDEGDQTLPLMGLRG